MLTLGIETSCDETGCAVCENGIILSNVVSSSVHLHKPYGGVVPEIASRYHLEYIDHVVKRALRGAGRRLQEIKLLAVTCGPGLMGSLLTGISYAKAVCYALNKPLVGVNHLYAHLYANFIGRQKCAKPPCFPFVGLVISGGHTNLYYVRSLNDIRLLGGTLDDAVGEAFDKVAKIMNLGYPGGPIVEKMARGSRGGHGICFPRPYLKPKSLDFSFSGLKTAVLYYARSNSMTAKRIRDVCFSFQESVFDVLCRKTLLACKAERSTTIVIGGGVAANKSLVNRMRSMAARNNIDVYIPEMEFCIDNGAMVAGLGERMFKAGKHGDLTLTAVPRPG